MGLVNFLPFKDSCNTNEDGQSIQQVLCYPNPLKMGQELFIKSANTNFSFYMFDTYGRKILLNVQYLNSVYTLIPQINGIGIYYLSAYDFIKQKSNTFVILVNWHTMNQYTTKIQRRKRWWWFEANFPFSMDSLKNKGEH